MREREREREKRERKREKRERERERETGMLTWVGSDSMFIEQTYAVCTMTVTS